MTRRARSNGAGASAPTGGTWPGVIRRYGAFLPVSGVTPVVTLLEGDTPLLAGAALSERARRRGLPQGRGANPTGSFKDRGMTVAITKAVEEGARP